MNGKRLGFIGGGNMAAALIGGVLEHGALGKDAVRVSEPSPERQKELSTKFGVLVTAKNQEVAEWANVLVLAVKPQVAAIVLPEIAAAVGIEKLVISICAGITVSRLETLLERYARVVRAMPNTPALVGAGVTAFARGREATDDDAATATALFDCVGQTVQIDEAQMDAVTGLSGSGPAYVLVAIEALIDGAVRVGLPRAIAAKLALQTVLGTAKLAQQTGEHPAVLKDRVTSPGGTTIAGLAALEAAGLRNALMSAVAAATERSAQLGASPRRSTPK